MAEQKNMALPDVTKAKLRTKIKNKYFPHLILTVLCNRGQQVKWEHVVCNPRSTCSFGSKLPAVGQNPS